MVQTLYLIRHGETEGSDEKRYKGSIDVSLSERGIKQIKEASLFISGRLRNTRPGPGVLAAVYSSPLIRAMRSAEILSEPHGLIPVVIEDLRERSFGVWEGKTFSEIKEMYPEEFELWVKNPLRFSPVGGESTLAVKKRVMGALRRILAEHNEANSGATAAREYTPEDIVIVAHGGVNRIILCELMGIHLRNIFRIEQDHAALNIIEFHSMCPVIKALNLNPWEVF